jgi:hypothetical protein
MPCTLEGVICAVVTPFGRRKSSMKPAWETIDFLIGAGTDLRGAGGF